MSTERAAIILVELHRGTGWLATELVDTPADKEAITQLFDRRYLVVKTRGDVQIIELTAKGHARAQLLLQQAAAAKARQAERS